MKGNTLSDTTLALFSMKYHVLFGIKTILCTSSKSTKIYLIELACTSVIYPTIISINIKSTSLNDKHKHIITYYANTRVWRKQQQTLKEIIWWKRTIKTIIFFIFIFLSQIRHPSKKHTSVELEIMELIKEITG